jgi:hypothetical protein
VVRIHCGGGEYRSPSGVVWGRDRFFTSGHQDMEDLERSDEVEDLLPFAGDVHGTESPPLYRTGRVFLSEDLHPAGYLLPLPPGRYRVTLHFAEVRLKAPERRAFDVLLEGKMVLENYDPASHGFATAEKKSFETEVRDGILSIEFVRRVRDPKISAIEIERL